MRDAAVIFGCEGHSLTDWELGFFAETKPHGFILFARNCDTPDQVRSLTEELRAVVGRDELPILIDQEGGRVARLRPPHWRAAPPAEVFGQLADFNRADAHHAAYLNARLFAAELADLGITVDCAPLLDLNLHGTHDVIGDRAYSDDPEVVAALAQTACDGFLDGGVLPVIKHIPGHGRALVDSHKELPRVSASHDELASTDFRPFQSLANAPWAMTAHIVYEALDPANPATTSRKVIEQVIRGEIGFDGVLISDDLSMQALSGDFKQRASRTLDAGCDLVLHCNGERAEMEEVAKGVRPLSDASQTRLEQAWQQRRSEDFDATQGRAELERLLAPLWKPST